MDSNLMLNATQVIRGKIQTVVGVPEDLSTSLWLPATNVTENPQNPVTTQAILASPDQRPIISYQTDSIEGFGADTFLFSGESFIGKRYTARTATAYFRATSGTTITVTAADTFVLNGVIATALTTPSTSMADLVEQFYEYVTNGTTPGADYSFTGTWDATWNLYIGTPATASAYFLLAASDPLSTVTPPSASGAIAGITRTAVTGTGTQLNLHQLYPFLVSAGLSPTFGYSLGLPETVSNAVDESLAFIDTEKQYLAAVSSDLTATNLIIQRLNSINLGTEGNTSVDTLRTEFATFKARVSQQPLSLRALNQAIISANNDFRSNIAQGLYYEAVSDYKLALADINGDGYITLTSSLNNNLAVTIQGITVTNTTGSPASAAEVVDVYLNGTSGSLTRSGTITSPYTAVSRPGNLNQIGFTKTGSYDVWDITYSSTMATFSAKVTYPLVTVFVTGAGRTTVSGLISDLTNSNDAKTITFNALKADLQTAWNKAVGNMTPEQSVYNAAVSGWLADFNTFSTDVTFLPSSLVYVYNYMEINDDGILGLERMSIQTLRFNENGTRAKSIIATDVVVSSLDLAIMANQPPQVKMTIVGEPVLDGTDFIDGSIVNFSEDRLKLMPEAKPGTITFQSLVLSSDVFLNENCQVQEFNLPNFAGVKIDRITTMSQNFHKVSVEPTNRKASITVIEGDLSAVVGGISDYKSLMNQKFKFKLGVGSLAGFRYTLNMEGLLTNDQPTQVQNSVAARQLELTVTSASLRIS